MFLDKYYKKVRGRKKSFYLREMLNYSNQDLLEDKYFNEYKNIR